MGSLLYGRKSENIPIDGNNKAPKILPMTHSHRRTPILPNHDVPSEKADKKHAHHVARRRRDEGLARRVAAALKASGPTSTTEKLSAI